MVKLFASEKVEKMWRLVFVTALRYYARICLWYWGKPWRILTKILRVGAEIRINDLLNAKREWLTVLRASS